MTDDFTVDADWYRTFFTAPVNAFWEMIVPEGATAADAAFIRRHVAQPPATMLDIPCGAGRHALALAGAGYRVTGIDLSDDAITRARAAGRGLCVDFRRGDMRSLALDKSFEAVLCLGNSLSYFPPDEMRTFIASLAARVASGGALILDTSCCAESLFPLAAEREVAFDGGTYRSFYNYDSRRSLLKTRAQLTLGGEVHLLRYAHYVVTCGELVRTVEDVGLRVQALHGGTDGETFAPGSPRLLLVATG